MEAMLSIAAVERDTGLSKDVLRVWERRYGFPDPQRDLHGERLYPASQVERLRLIKRLMDQGHRPGRLVGAPAEALAALAQRPAPVARQGAPEAADELDHLVTMIRQHQAAGFLQLMQQRLARYGLRGFVLDTVAPLTESVGHAWEEGRLHVFEEHLFTEMTTRVLRQAIGAVSGGAAPRVLLTSLPDEPHGMGLLMVEGLLALEGAQCVALGTQMPLLEIVQAAVGHRADVVALSFSRAFPARQIAGLLQQLRAALPPEVDLWAGGQGMRKVAALPGVLPGLSLEDAERALRQWRQARHG
ncbi:MAG: MerR family transcriptional regulator [Pseudomonadota bacterium]